MFTINILLYIAMFSITIVSLLITEVNGMDDIGILQKFIIFLEFCICTVMKWQSKIL